MSRAADERLDVRAACEFIGGSRPINPATLYRGIQRGDFPRPIKVGAAQFVGSVLNCRTQWSD